MGKFAMECPNCGKYAVAYNGLAGLLHNKIQCSCGYEINVRAERMNSKICDHCGNMVMYDRGLGEAATCPVCGELINTLEQQMRRIEVKCPHCGVHFQTVDTETEAKCPVCDAMVNVQQEVQKMKELNREGTVEIRYEGDNQSLVWRHPMTEIQPGSQVVVHESQDAILFHDGRALEVLPSGRYTLDNEHFPMIQPRGDGLLYCEVYFVNLVTQMGLRWGTKDLMQVMDSEFQIPFEIGASGEFNIKIVDSRKFLLSMVGTETEVNREQALGGGLGDQTQAVDSGYIRNLIRSKVGTYLPRMIEERNISIIRVDVHKGDLSKELRERLNQDLWDYGLTMPEFTLDRIRKPVEDPRYQRIMDQFGDRLDVVDEINKAKTAQAAGERKAAETEAENRRKTLEAQGEMEIQRLRAQAEAEVLKVQAQAQAEALKMQAEAKAQAYAMQAQAEAQEMQMKNYTFQQDTDRKIAMEAVKRSGGILGDMVMEKAAAELAGEKAKEAMNSIQKGNTADSTWDCSCGEKGITSKFCPNCGSKKPESWDCSCGQKGITSKFCPNCGNKKPESWDCSCGRKGITSKFCPECGNKKPEGNLQWDCSCGEKGITSKFCPNCGKERA